MGTPHKHRDLIKAWADGAIIEYYRVGFGWEECSFNTPYWLPETNYRIKPKTIKYRNFLWEQQCGLTPGKKIVCICSEQENQYESREKWLGFIKWLGNWQEVEV